ncbi:MAG: hypothetical protein Q9166_004590 [cf. Caloplaca sp. 2 TL-2023]
MRYLYWDVLVFPEQSRVPLQEFKTTCHVSYDPDPIGTNDSTPSNLSANPVAQRQLPIVTCFVPSLEYGCPFRVSLHSWQEPEASRGTLALTSPKDGVFFEARVLLDGVYAGASTDTCSKADKTGNQECLRFPPFHQEMLTQNWWSAGEDIGRVKVVISEGVGVGQGPPSAFRRVKNIVSFSFQHAPLGKYRVVGKVLAPRIHGVPAVLEDAGIAWPNAGMWYQTSQQLYAPNSPCKLGATDTDAHAHSPRRRNASAGYNTNATAALVAPRMLMNVSMPPPARRNAMMSDSSWTCNNHTQDPFFELNRHQVPRTWGTRVSTSDDSMPDYSHSVTPQSSRNPSLHDTQNIHGGSVLQQESQFEELIAAFSPARTNGTHAPPTTRVSSASNTPPTTFGTLGGPDPRAGSFPGQPRSVSMTTREAPPRSAREPSDTSMKSRFSETSQVSEQQATAEGHAHAKVKRTPANEVKGRKEGRCSETDLLAPPSRQMGTVKRRQKSMTNNGDEKAAVVGDGKRKREGIASISDLLSEASEGLGSSPSRKLSKKGSKDSLSNPAARAATQEDSARSPLSALENIQ